MTSHSLENRVYYMLKIRNALILLGVLLPSVGCTNTPVSMGVGLPHASVGIHLIAYPEFVVVPGYPVYYAPQLEVNFFFYDGLYWVYQDDNWYFSSWYDGPWVFVNPQAVPLVILQVPVRYYRKPPVYFRGWSADAPPRWGDHWGRDWEQRRSGWDKADRRVDLKPAPLPVYQKQYSGNRYPKQEQQQHEIQQKSYRYEPRDPEVRQHYVTQQRRHQQERP